MDIEIQRQLGRSALHEFIQIAIHFIFAIEYRLEIGERTEVNDSDRKNPQVKTMSFENLDEPWNGSDDWHFIFLVAKLKCGTSSLLPQLLCRL